MRGGEKISRASRHPSSYEEGKKSVELRATPPRTSRGKISRASRHPSSYEQGKNQSSFAPPLLVRGGGKISRASRRPFKETKFALVSMSPPHRGGVPPKAA